jgi:hypothetical protein
MKSVLRLLLVAVVLSSLGLAQTPRLTILVNPKVVGASGTTTTLENPAAYYVQIDSLKPNTAYEQEHMGYLQNTAPTTTRGSKWVPGSGWVSPSGIYPFRTSDASGVIKAWIYLRIPSTFTFNNTPTSDTVRGATRMRIREAGTTARLTFDSPFDLPGYYFDATKTAPVAGAVVYGYTDTTVQNNGGKMILAYENAGDARPLAAWFIYPGAPDNASDLYRTRTDTLLRRNGYFQLLVPADATIGKIEVRDSNNSVLRTQLSTKWKAGASGSMTNLGDIDPIVLAVHEMDSGIPDGYALSQNYPNPFNPDTRINFSIPERARVRIAVYNVLGQEVALLADDEFSPGTRYVTWDGAGFGGRVLPSGTYIYRLTSKSFTESRRMVLLK